MEENKEEKREKEQDLLQTLTLLLFDLLWFRRLILLHPLPPPPLPPATPPPPPPEVEDAESNTASPSPPANLLRRRSLHRRSLSDDLPPSPTSSMLQIRTPKLQTILSGKETTAISDEIPRFEADGRDRRRRRRERRRRRSESSKSMSELEFEELKGFMDLGFTFSDVGADPRLMEIVPGLQRLKAADDEASSSSCASADDDTAVPRPYLSEAWDAAEEEGINRLRNFKIPIGDGGGGGVDLKDQLRFWAHAVASTVR